MARKRLPPLALAYHGVSAIPLRRDPMGLFVAPRDLERQVATLRGWGYELVTFGELAARVAGGHGPGAAALTFDDGLVDNLTTLSPLLARLQAPATVFVVSGWLGRPYPWGGWTRLMTAEELRDLHGSGVEIGAHSATHPDLAALGYRGARAELACSKESLEGLLGMAVDVAAYPFGRATADTRRAAADAGFLAACRCTGWGSWAELLDLPRQDMDNRCTTLGLRLKRDGRYEPLMRIRPARAARRLGRLARSVAR